MLEIKDSNNGLIIKLRVQPGAKSSKIKGLWQASLKMSVTAAPEAGKANKACIELLSANLRIHKSKMKIVKGINSRNKEALFLDISRQELLDKLNLTP